MSRNLIEAIKKNNAVASAIRGGKNLKESLAMDKEALELYLEHIKEKMYPFKDRSERLHYLFDNGYYDKTLLKRYSISEMIIIDSFARSLGHKHESFMDANKFYDSYALKTFGNILLDGEKEKYEAEMTKEEKELMEVSGMKIEDKFGKQYILEDFIDRIVMIALHMGRGSFRDAREYAYAMAMKYFQPATPIMQNGGLANGGKLISCFLGDIPDSLNGITEKQSEASYLSKHGGGIAYNLDYIRGKGDPIRKRMGASSGPLPFAKWFDATAVAVNQLGQRDGAIALYMSVWHNEFIEFLDTKKISSDENLRLNNTSLGVNIPNVFYEYAKENKDWYMFSPLHVEKVYGVSPADMDMDKMYDVILKDDRIPKRKSPLNARAIADKIAYTQMQSGYPYMFFTSNANKSHANKHLGRVKLSNLCTEISQVSVPTVYNDHGQEDELGYGIMCCLSSVNLYNALKDGQLAYVTRLLVRFLSSVLEETEITNVPEVEKAKNELRAIGIGIMNYTGTIFDKLEQYGGKVSLELADIVGMTMIYNAMLESNRLAKKTGKPFKTFEKSEYANGEFFKRKDYLEVNYKEANKTAYDKFFNEEIPNIEDWKDLKEEIEKYGMYNAYLMAIAPNQSSAYIQNATSGVMPNTQIIEERKYGDSLTYFPMPFLREDNFLLYSKTAYNMDQKDILRVVAYFQRHIDQAISCTLFYNSDVPTNTLVKDMHYGNQIGLKSIYYVRPNNNSDFDECLACGV